MINVLIFSISSYWFGLKYHEVREVIHLVNLHQLPGMPSIFEGFLNLGGEILPVLRLEKMVKDEQFPAYGLSLYSPIIVLKTKPPFALLGEALITSCTLRDDQIIPLAPEDLFNAYISGFFSWKNKRVYLLEGGKLLLEEEKVRAGEFLAMAEERIKAMAHEQ